VNREYLYRAGMLCLSLAIVAFAIPHLVFEGASPRWYDLSLFLLCAGTALAANRPAPPRS
jgi:hypothetical protein